MKLGLVSVYQESAIATHHRFKHYYSVMGQAAEWEARQAELKARFAKTQELIKIHGRYAEAPKNGNQEV